MIVNFETQPAPEMDADAYYILAARSHRNRFLSASDWTQMPDSPLTSEQRQAWAEYRQALRDFPSTWTPGPEANFPDPPEVN